jgi:hypothetical protein
MKNYLNQKLLTGLVALLLVAFTFSAARALNFGDILKVGGVGLLVDTYRKPINNFINKTLGERGAQAMGATKVVAILSVGSGGYIGAAQVVGVPEAIDKTQAVVQIELTVGSFLATGYVPVSTKGVGGGPKRLKGVGVSAVVEFKI